MRNLRRHKRLPVKIPRRLLDFGLPVIPKFRHWAVPELRHDLAEVEPVEMDLRLDGRQVIKNLPAIFGWIRSEWLTHERNFFWSQLRESNP